MEALSELHQFEALLDRQDSRGVDQRVHQMHRHLVRDTHPVAAQSLDCVTIDCGSGHLGDERLMSLLVLLSEARQLVDRSLCDRGF